MELPQNTSLEAKKCQNTCTLFEEYKATYEALLNRLYEVIEERADILEAVRIWGNAQINHPAKTLNDEIIEQFNRNLQNNLENADETIKRLQNKINQCDQAISYCQSRINNHREQCEEAKKNN